MNIDKFDEDARDRYYRRLALVLAHMPKIADRGVGPLPSDDGVDVVGPYPMWYEFHGMTVCASLEPTDDPEFAPGGWEFRIIAEPGAGGYITDKMLGHLLVSFTDDPKNTGELVYPNSRTGKIRFRMPARQHTVPESAISKLRPNLKPFIHRDWLMRYIPSLARRLTTQARAAEFNPFFSGYRDKDASDIDLYRAYLGAALVAYEDCGQNVVYVPDGLRAALERTEPPPLSTFTQLPWDSFYMCFESPTEEGYIGVYFASDERPMVEPGQAPEGHVVGELARCFTLLGVFEPPNAGAMTPKMWNKELSQWGSPTSALFFNVLAYVAYSPEERRVDDSGPRERASLERQLKRVKGGQKRAKLQRRLERTSGATVVYLGGADLDDARPGPSEAAGPRREHWVRGHWRNQAFGEGQKQRRLKWIRPHRRCLGAEAGTIIQKTYKLPDTVA